MKELTFSLLFILIISESFSQSFNEHSFKVQTTCTLNQVLNTFDDGNKVEVYQCIEQANTISIYRVNVITFKDQITNEEAYIKKLHSDYQQLGSTSVTNFKGKKAVEVTEDVTIEGHKFKQLSLSFLHKNKGITIVLVTNSLSPSSLLDIYKEAFTFI